MDKNLNAENVANIQARKKLGHLQVVKFWACDQKFEKHNMKIRNLDLIK
jgi:hypothetical protein